MNLKGQAANGRDGEDHAFIAPLFSSRLSRPDNRKDPSMLAIVAAILFAIAFILNASGTATSAVFDTTSLLLVGLACLALHLAGVGSGWSWRR
jgi:hypothetical protein